MERAYTIYKFGLPYLWKYRVRFGLSILLGFLFASLNAAFIPATKLLVDRIAGDEPIVQSAPATPPEPTPVAEPEAAPEEESEWSKNMKAYGQSFADTWLPRSGQMMDWKQGVGAFLLLPLLSLMRGVANFLSSYYSTWVAAKVVNDMRTDVFNRLQKMSMDFFHKEEQAATLGRVIADSQAMNTLLQLGLQDAIKSPFSIIMILGFLMMIDWQLTLLFLVFMPIIMVPTIIVSKKVRKRSVKSHLVNEKMNSALLEGFTNVRVTKAFNLGGEQARQFVNRMEEVRKLELSSFKARYMLNPIVEFISALGVGTIIVFIFATNRSVGDLTGFLVGLGMLFAPVKKLAGLPNYFANTYRPVSRLLEIQTTEPSVKNKPDAKPVKAFHEALAFEKIDFAYEEDEMVLEGLDFRLPVGKRLGLAGHSGSGKSTIVNLVFRFYDPTRGRVTLDGKDLRDLDIHTYREQLSLVSQDVLLFNLTVAENIAMGRLSDPPSREEIEEAARKAHAHDFIMKLPEGYDTPIGERGERLSGGQRQRLSIARAFVRDAPILVLDEATGALDAEAEAVVQQAIDNLAENRTVICIAHRLATLFSMDEIIVMEEGRAVERGSFSRLLESGGIFAGMAKRQGIQLDSLTGAKPQNTLTKG